MGACETTCGRDWQGCWELPTGQRLMPRPKARSWAKGLGGVQGQWVVIARTRRCALMSSQLLESVRALVGRFGEACRLPRLVTFDGVPQQRSHQAGSLRSFLSDKTAVTLPMMRSRGSLKCALALCAHQRLLADIADSARSGGLGDLGTTAVGAETAISRHGSLKRLDWRSTKTSLALSHQGMDGS